jgi:hydrogenase-4 transcriptional activator
MSQLATSSGRGMAQEFSAVQQVNGIFHQDAVSQSTILSEVETLDHAPAQLTRSAAFSDIDYASRAMDEIIIKIERSRNSSAAMLITGETGTGKELIARAVHAVSDRSDREFIPFDCGAAPPELIASELFGHQKGAFTSADRTRKGVIREADGCTLFLDEIGELPLAAQVKFLRFLQEGEVRPLGETKPIKVNVRVIAATNRDLEAEVRAGRFRADLFQRLNILRLHIPPLRERREDIPLLIEHFLHRSQQELGKPGIRLSDEAWTLMFGYHWPGNVREMENLLYRLVAFAGNGEVIGPERFLEEIGRCSPPPAAAIIEGMFVIDPRLPYSERQKELERLSIINALKETGGNITRAAAMMGICRNGLKNKIKRFGIKIENHRQPQAR